MDDGAKCGSQMVSVNADAFALQLATSLSRILPPGFAATAAGARIHVDAPDGFGSTIWLDIVEDVERGPERFETAAWQVLSSAQDVVSETTGMPWPRASGVALDLALPFTRVERGTLHLWFGDEHAPAVTLTPIAL
jgi:hypothetical protein